ncbi:MAG: hypothetical protein ACLST1_11305 [[Eubacterium] siraeum]
MRITDEQKERAAFVNLPQFLMAHGFDLKKSVKSMWKDHDSLHIKDNGPGERGAWFRFSEDKGGDNMDSCVNTWECLSLMRSKLSRANTSTAPIFRPAHTNRSRKQ